MASAGKRGTAHVIAFLSAGSWPVISDQAPASPAATHFLIEPSARHGERGMFGRFPLLRSGAPAQEPTQALPGTEEKIRVMIERAALREQLFHPLDGQVGAA